VKTEPSALQKGKLVFYTRDKRLMRTASSHTLDREKRKKEKYSRPKKSVNSHSKERTEGKLRSEAKSLRKNQCHKE